MVTSLGAWLIEANKICSEFFSMVAQTLAGAFRPPFRIRDVVKQIHFVANGSVFIVVFCVCFAAMVTILESSYHMKLVIQNDSMVPGFASMLILKELGAVVTALLLTSRVGAGMTAEVGLMQITEQIDALKMLGIEPVKYLVVPRLLAGLFAGVVLTIIANMICIYCAMLVSKLYLGFTEGMFITAMTRFVHFSDLLESIVKGACFGIVIPLVSCFFGFKCKPGAEGVGTATTNSVVVSSIVIIIIDFLLSYMFT
jgi:phospholipid/cholesterol/gamma-HCH transport system permease protein